MTTYTLINQPPNYTNITYNGKTVVTWQRWFNTVYSAWNEFFPSSASDSLTFPIFTVSQLTTTQCDALVNVSNGAIIYNTTTNAFNFYENGAWVTK